MKTWKWTQLYCLFVLNLMTVISLSAEDLLLPPETDSMALIAIYEATSGENWTNTWDLNEPFSTWFGIETNATGCVRKISLTANELIGTIPTEIGNFSQIEVIQMSDNELSGPIPSEIGQLDSLRGFYIGRNQLTGEMPIELTTLPNLNYFGIDMNFLSGEIPAEIGNMTELRGLYIAHNDFTGNLPPEIGNLVNLKVLRVYANQLEGEFPTEIGNLNNLDSLFAQNNQFSGNIPSSIGDMTNLKTCSLFGNEFNGNIPAEIGNLNQLKVLELHNNNLSGSIPTTINNNNILRIRLDNNALTGNIPAAFSNLTGIQYLNLSNNFLEGSLPIFLTELSSLQDLFVNDNLFEGCFPPEYDFFCDRNVNFSDNPNLANNGNFSEFCSSEIGSCLSNVYPGDANNDGIVDLLDVFTLAYKNQNFGLSREEISIEWTPISSYNWGNSLPDGIENKYADCDGDGEVFIFLDMDAVVVNFDSTHTIAPPSLFPLTPDRLNISLAATNYINSEYEFSYKLTYQDVDEMDADVYGLAFKLNYDNAATFETLNISNTSLATNLDNLYTFSHDNLSENSTEVAIVKINNTNTNSVNSVADFIIVEENIPSIGEGVPLTISDILMTDNLGNIVSSLNTSSEVFLMSAANEGVDEENLLSMTIDTIVSNCNGGTAKANIIGGTGPYTYNWENAQTDSVATELLLGNHIVTVTDAENRMLVGHTEITGVPIIQTIFAVNDNQNGTQSIAITSLSGGSGNLSIEWENGDTNYVTNVADSLLLTGEYFVTITDATGCARTETVLVEISTDTENQAFLSPNMNCNIFPNPANTYLNISLTNLPENQQFQLVVTNKLGQIISTQDIGKASATGQIDLEKDIRMLNSEVYLLQVTSKNQIILSTPFVKKS